MPICPHCSGDLTPDERTCPACGLSIADESAPTSIKPPEDTPTRIQESKTPPSGFSTSPGSHRFLAGTILAKRYRILTLIGKGGMGEVYKAEDLELEQTVALKFLPEELSANEELLRRFRGEVRTARQVSHPNVCKVFDIGEVDGLYYLSMEFIEGDDLSMLLHRIRRLPSDKAVEISRQISLGLGAIHKAGILHRDLKPSNIIIDSNGEARITDFGIAGIEAEVQGEEVRVGTPAYMSPEQITGTEVTKLSDIYSLGLLLYEIFTGKQAFEGNSVQEFRFKQTKENPTNPSEFVTDIDHAVVDLIERCLKKNPEQRPDSALKVAMMLPGGDPLHIALEAGMTPTPEMVAAAPKKGTLSRAVGLALTVAFISMFIGMLYVKSVYQQSLASPLTKPQPVLEERAKEIASGLGYKDPPVGVSSWFETDPLVKAYASDQPNWEEFLSSTGTGQPAFFKFVYRQSFKLMVPLDRLGPITAQDPPMLEPGMIRMELDVTGRLIKFTAVPVAPDQAAKPETETDWAAAFELAGLSISDFKATEPEGIPLFFADKTASWRGALAGNPDIDALVVGNSLAGKVTSFEIRAPWNKSALPTVKSKNGSQRQDTVIFILFALFLIILLAAIALARHNLKQGRADFAGALKLFTSTYLIFCIGLVFVTPLTGSPMDDLGRIAYLATANLLWPFVLSLLYLAIEPVARKRFPDLLVSWNRLLTGKFTDSLLGRDILIGLTIGISLNWLTELVRGALALVKGRPIDPFRWQYVQNLDALYGLGHVTSTSLFTVIGFLTLAFLLFSWFLLLSLLIRKRMWALAAAVFVGIIPAIPGSIAGGDIGSILELGLFLAVTLLCLVRYGLVAIWMVIFMLPRSELYTFDSGKFFAAATFLTIGYSAALAFAAFLTATRGQPWFKRDLLE